MLYPKILNIKKEKIVIQSLALGSILLSASLIVINQLTTPEIKWAYLAILGIIYVWITTMYSVKKNRNIASHTMVQMLCLGTFLIGIDWCLGFSGWSFKVGLPITLIVANINILILTIATRKKYYRYAIYQMIIFFITMLTFLLQKLQILPVGILYEIAKLISLLAIIVSVLLYKNNILTEIARRFHF